APPGSPGNEGPEVTLPGDEQQEGRDDFRPAPPDGSAAPDPTGEASSSPPVSPGATSASGTASQDQGGSRRASRRRRGQPTGESPAEDGRINRAVRTIRMGHIRAAIRLDPTGSGISYSTTFERISRVDDEEGQ